VDYEMTSVKAVGLLKEASKSLEEALFVNPENNFIEEADRRIRDAIIVLTTERYNRPHNKDCLNCSNSFGIKNERLICMEKQKAGKTVEESIVPEDGYCEEWN
jgi:tRNA 2-selenouridine synthase SelU